MNLKKLLSYISAEPSKEEMDKLKISAKEAISLLNNAFSKEKVRGEVFVGGSFAKNTMVRKEQYDVDIFVRFNPEYEDLTSLLSRAVKKAFGKGWNIERVHGSRDYFKVYKENRIIFEIIPVLKIKKPKESRNVTDLSYFHVKYVNSKLNSKIRREIALAKLFCKAQGVYGAESYISGFSGYALECLIIYYKTFENMIKELAKAKAQIIMDPLKHYKDKNEVAISMNESKMRSPIVLVDPTWKERNVLAALNIETFRKFQESANKLLKRPDVKYFIPSEIDKIGLRATALKNDGELLEIDMITLRQRGDIAGTKLKTFANFLGRELNKRFLVHKREFEYDGDKKGKAYYALSKKKDLIQRGPPIEMKRHAKQFRKEHPNSYVKEGVLFCKIKELNSAKEFVKEWMKENQIKIKDMDIVKLEIKD